MNFYRTSRPRQISLVWSGNGFFKPGISRLDLIDLLYKLLYRDKCSVTDWTASCEVNVLEDDSDLKKCVITLFSLSDRLAPVLSLPLQRFKEPSESLKLEVVLHLFHNWHPCSVDVWHIFEFIYNMWEQHKCVSFMGVSCIQLGKI